MCYISIVTYIAELARSIGRKESATADFYNSTLFEEIGTGIDKEAIGNRLDALFTKYDISTEQVGNLFNISYQAVYKWRNGYAVPELDSLYYLSRMFGVTLDYIICGEKEPTKAMYIESSHTKEDR